MKRGGILYTRRQKFIKLMVDVKDGPDMIRIYKECYPNCKKDTSAKSACLRLLTDADLMSEIDKLRRDKEEALKQARQKEIERLAREQVITETVIDAKLSSIVNGTHRRKKTIAKYDHQEKQFRKMTIEEEPDETAVVAAANLLYKRKGSYAEKKIKHEMGDSFIEALKSISQRKKSSDVQP